MIYGKKETAKNLGKCISSDLKHRILALNRAMEGGPPNEEDINQYFQCHTMPFRGNFIESDKYHLGNSQIVFQRRKRGSYHFGNVKEIGFGESNKKYYLLVKEMKKANIISENHPFGEFPKLQAEVLDISCTEVVLVSSVEVVGHFAALKSDLGMFGSLEDTLCVVMVHFSVSFSESIVEIKGKF